MNDLIKGWGDWLGTYQWTHASTLTFRRPNTQTGARRAVDRHLRDLARRAHRRVDWFWVMERTCQGHVHIHALVDAPMSACEVKASWQAGRAKVEGYDPARGWRYYIVKDIGTQVLDYDLTRRPM